MINTDTSQNYLPAKFHNFKISGLFFIHKNIRVQFFYETRCSRVSKQAGGFRVHSAFRICLFISIVAMPFCVDFYLTFDLSLFVLFATIE